MNDHNGDITESTKNYEKGLYFQNDSGCLHQSFFYSFSVILIASGCSQMDMNGLRLVTTGSS